MQGYDERLCNGKTRGLMVMEREFLIATVMPGLGAALLPGVVVEGHQGIGYLGL
jgi:hypothetical protein